MIKIEKKDLIIIGIIVGIALFFVGGMIYRVFPPTEDALMSYKVSSFLKMIGLGFLTSSMIVGAIIVKNIDKNLKMLLMILGLIILLIYAMASPMLMWDISDEDYEPTDDDNYTSDGMYTSSEKQEAYKEAPETPGFEFFYLITAIAVIALFFKKYKK
jgi:hypothetical protein